MCKKGKAGGRSGRQETRSRSRESAAKRGCAERVWIEGEGRRAGVYYIVTRRRNATPTYGSRVKNNINNDAVLTRS